jgi:uncharacterized protein YggU (UPF0235/DUF167 family)
VRAPPVPKANAALADLVAGALGVPRARVRVVGGQAARRKVVEIEGVDAAEIKRRLG